ncbi:MAG: enoyl-[acyl-carrier-protein] reductase FabL [Chloroflexota bacterium]
MRFENKIALVTGSGRGIGKAIALQLASEGADIVVNFLRKRTPAAETADEIRAMGRRAHLIKANVGESDQIEKMFAEVKEVFGGLDILVCNAASGYIRPVLQQEVKGWDWTMNINARSVLFCAQHAHPLMKARGGGAIVSISSLGAIRVMPEYVVIGASKAAVEALTRYLAFEFATDNIVVNAVSGGIVETDALDHFPRKEQMLSEGLARTPAGRLATPQDFAKVVAFLCSPDAAMIRGQTIIVDGGFTLPT